VACKIVFFPVAVCETFFFFLMSLVLAPVAYFVHFSRLVGIAFRADQGGYKMVSILHAAEFLLNGIIYLLISMFSDPVKFFINLWTRPQFDDSDIIDDSIHISREALNMFEEACDDVINYDKQGENNSMVDFVSFNKIMQLKFKLISEVYSLIYVHHGEKFIYDKKSKRQKLNPIYLQRIKEYIRFKDMIISSAETNTDLVDLRMLRSFIEQVDIRIMILKVNIQQGISHLPGGKSLDDLFKESIKEMTMTRPNQVYNALEAKDDTFE